MANITDQFISSFHSIDGTTLGERRKNLHLLLNTISGNEIDFSRLTPQTHLEDVFKIEAFIYYRKIPEMLDVLKSENFVLINKILKCDSWFFKGAFANIDGEELINDFFPKTSFQVKVKLLHKLSLHLDDEQKLDEYFRAVRKSYGLYLANRLLPSCSAVLIMEVFQSSRVVLPAGDFLRIVKKHPDLTQQILSSLSSYLSKYKIKTTYKGTFVHLAKIDHPSFFALFFEYKPLVCLGWRSTEKMIKEHKEVVTTHALDCSNFLHSKQIFKSMGRNYFDFYIKLFPPTILEFESSLTFLLKLLQAIGSNEKKLCVLEEAFKNVYKRDLLKTPSCLKKSLIDLVPLEKFVLLTKPDYMSEDRWSCYLKIEKSIPLLKQQIRLTSNVTKRADLVGLLVETCRINDDKVALTGVCKYFLERHRNDDAKVRQRFLATIRHSFKLEELEKVHWDAINDLIDIFKLNKESFGLSNEFVVAYIINQFLNDLPIDDLIVGYAKSSVIQWSAFKKYPVLEKYFLTSMGQILSNSILNSTMLLRENCQYLNALIDWNRRHLDDPISLLSKRAVIDLFKSSLSENKMLGNSQSVIVYFLRKKLHEIDYVDDDFLDLCLSKLDLYHLTYLELRRFLKHRPLVVLSNVDIVIELALKRPSRVFWRSLQNYAHLGIPALFSKKLFDIYQTSDQSANRKQTASIFMATSILMSSNEFLRFCAKLHPINSKYDPSDPSGKNHFILGNLIGKSLRNVVPPSSSIESLLKFCQGDYLKFILSSLYSIAGRTNENRLSLLLDTLASRPMSVHKHSLHLSLRTRNKIQLEAILSTLTDGLQRNPSMRKFVFKGCFNLFVQDPSLNLWGLLKTNLQKIDDKDREVGLFLTEFISKVSICYIIEYIALTCDFLQKRSNEPKTGEEYDFLRQLSKSVIQRFPIESHTSLVRLLAKNLNSEALCWLVCRSIVYVPHDVARISCLSPIFERYFARTNKEHVLCFVKEFCSNFLQRECGSLQILETFATHWYRQVAPLQAFRAHLHLELTSIYVRSTNENLAPFEIGKKLGEFCDLTAKSHGVAVSGLLGLKVANFYHHFEKDFRGKHDNSCCSLMDGIIRSSSSTASLIVVSFLLEPSETCQHDKIKEIMRGFDNPAVVAYLSTVYEFNCRN